MIVWIASYPRSGNTFFRTVLHSAFGLKTWSIYPEGRTGGGIAGDVTGHHAFGPDFRLQDAAKADGIYCVKTHGKPTDDSKAIYLIRDGRGSIASFYHFIRNFNNKQPTMQDVITGNVMFGSWAAHVMSWRPRLRENTLLVKFEELVADPQSQYSRIQKFLDIPVKVGAIVPGFEQLQARDANFFRSGKNNAWEKDFSEDDHNLFWALHGEIMAEYGYCQPAAVLHRASRGAWRLAGDAARLRNELNELTESQAGIPRHQFPEEAVATARNN